MLLVALVKAIIFLVLVVKILLWLHRRFSGMSGQQRSADLAGETIPSSAPSDVRSRPRLALPKNAESVALEKRVRERLSLHLQSISKKAQELGKEVEHERANRRFAKLLTEWIPRQAQLLENELAKGSQGEFGHATGVLNIVLEEVSELIGQRRDEKQVVDLGDADALADACYQPIVQFAQAEGLPLATAWPVTRLSKANLAVWTGFAPTSVAPIFLPPRFFKQLSLWPALGHEIGHDFLVSVRDLDSDLRQEMGIVDEDQGVLPLQIDYQGIAVSEIQRIWGAWFEETFCDVFGTLMFGPAYVATMGEHFAFREQPQESLLVGQNHRSGRYDPHPPAYLRVYVGCWVLRRVGLESDASKIWNRWNTRHEFLSSSEEEQCLYFPVDGEYVGLPWKIFTSTAEPILERLYSGPLAALSGMGLGSVAGLDFGVHQQAESLRACEQLLAGLVPKVRDPRSVISGAVLAYFQQPEAQQKILQLARAAIPARGTLEHRSDAYRPAKLEKKSPTALELHPQALVEALVLREVLERRR